jgi:hypothetical protein
MGSNPIPFMLLMGYTSFINMKTECIIFKSMAQSSANIQNPNDNLKDLEKKIECGLNLIVNMTKYCVFY